MEKMDLCLKLMILQQVWFIYILMLQQTMHFQIDDLELSVFD